MLLRYLSLIASNDYNGNTKGDLSVARIATLFFVHRKKQKTKMS